jgi:hypothetical protein
VLERRLAVRDGCRQVAHQHRDERQPQLDGHRQRRIPLGVVERLHEELDRAREIVVVVALLGEKTKRLRSQRARWRGGEDPLEEGACAVSVPGAEVMVGCLQLAAAPVIGPVGRRRRARALEQLRSRLGCAATAGCRPRPLEGRGDLLVRLVRRERQVLRALLEIVDDGCETAMDGSALVRRGGRVDRRSEQRMREHDRAAGLASDDVRRNGRSERFVDGLVARL